jgi:DNA-binding NtrC family response regulator
MHQVRVTAYPLISSNGGLYMGEMIEEITAPEQRLNDNERMVGKAPAFTACMQQLGLVAASEIPVLLQGETGTGKELAANYVHRGSSRSTKPFVTVDCTVLTDTLFEAEVFGHARGAFTGSVGERPGLFEQANGGTLFLDEVGELPPSQQAKLLRVLETGKYRRVGGRGTRKADVRLICASNVHLWEAVQAGRFREDLYYRIACLTIRLPSLRERMDDIPLLADTLLNPVSKSLKRSLIIMPDAMERLQSHDYPGNIRELRNILFVSATQSRNGKITAALVDAATGHLSRSLGPARMAAEVARPGTEQKTARGTAVAEPKAAGVASLHDIEAQHITALLSKHNGNRKQVAASLNISERTLYRKLKKYSLA